MPNYPHTVIVSQPFFPPAVELTILDPFHFGTKFSGQTGLCTWNRASVSGLTVPRVPPVVLERIDANGSTRVFLLCLTGSPLNIFDSEKKTWIHSALGLVSRVFFPIHCVARPRRLSTCTSGMVLSAPRTHIASACLGLHLSVDGAETKTRCRSFAWGPNSFSVFSSSSFFLGGGWDW